MAKDDKIENRPTTARNSAIATDTITPIWSEQAEKAVLGSILIDNRLLDHVSSEIGEDHFYGSDSKKVFRAFLDGQRDCKTLEPVALGEYISRSDFPLSAWCELEGAVLTTANIDTHLRVLKERYTQRMLVKQIHSVLSHAQEGAKPEDTTSGLQSIIDRSAGIGNTKVRTIGECITEYNERLDKALASGAEYSGLTTDFPEINKLTSGLQPGNLIIIGARPSVGKTALACQIMLSAALKNEQVLFFSCEMPSHQIVSRFLSKRTGIHLSKVMAMSRINENEVDIISEKSRDLSNKPLYIDDTSNIDISLLSARAKSWARKVENPSLIVIDYVQLIQNKNARRGASDYEKLTEISVTIKNIARVNNCPVLLLSQIKRLGIPVDKKQLKPRLEDLKGSGSLEQDADVVILLHRASIDEETGTQDIDLMVEKNRNGPIGICHTVFNGALMRFNEIAKEY